VIPVFDAHCDTLFHLSLNSDSLASSFGHLDLDRIQTLYAPYAQFFAVYSDAALPGPPMWERFEQGRELFLREMERHSDRIIHCRTAEEAEWAAGQGKAAAFLSVEGGELLDCDVEKLELAWRWGVRSVNLTWNHANALSGSHKDRPEQGLTQQGRAFVRKMWQLGILIDVSHLSDPGFWDVLECVPGPVIASHSNARDVFFHTRNLTDEQITAIIEHQGIVGLNLYVDFLGHDPDVNTVIAHLEHILELGGEDTVALGGDWDGASPLAKGFEDITGWHHLYEELLRRNYSPSLVQKIFYSNMMRVVKKVCST